MALRHLTVGGEQFASWLWGDPATTAGPDARPVLFLLHGAGMSSMGWAMCAERIAAGGVVCCGLDLRGHGATEASQFDRPLSLPQLVEDTVGCVEAALEQLPPDPARQVYLAGHSLGGAVAANVALDARVRPRLAGLCLVDIVEDTAVQNLRHMDALLEQRPASFPSVPDAVEWFLTKGGLRGRASALRSVPALLRPLPEGGVTWVMDLAATAPQWAGWFGGMDGLFVAAPCPKMLLLANTDRLDRALTVAQMQGKFQMEVVRDTGHYVMEDDPETVAAKLVRFVTRIDTLNRQLRNKQFTLGR